MKMSLRSFLATFPTEAVVLFEHLTAYAHGLKKRPLFRPWQRGLYQRLISSVPDAELSPRKLVVTILIDSTEDLPDAFLLLLFVCALNVKIALHRLISGHHIT